MRKRYLDWLRGVAVIVMVLAHVNDAWTIDADRERTLYLVVIFIAGLAAPLFLYLAGLTLSMAAVAKAATLGHAAAAAAARRRGWQIFALAFIFRLQSQLLGWGAFSNFLKVDILNVMGVSMIAAGWLWSLSASRAVADCRVCGRHDGDHDADADHPRAAVAGAAARRHRGLHPPDCRPHHLHDLSVVRLPLRRA